MYQNAGSVIIHVVFSGIQWANGADKRVRVPSTKTTGRNENDNKKGV